jgi:hypothetical protein
MVALLIGAALAGTMTSGLVKKLAWTVVLAIGAWQAWKAWLG